jgi:type VI protein secretion system component Hcp
MNAETGVELSDNQLDAVAGGTKVRVQEITIKKYFDKSSPTLG